MSVWQITCLYEFFDDVPAQNVVENGLHEVIVDDAQFELVPVPDQYPGLLQGHDGNLEQLVCADAEPFRRIQELVRENYVQGSAALRHD